MRRWLPRTGAVAAIALAVACDDRSTETRTFVLSHMSPDNAVVLLQPYLDDAAVSIRDSTSPPVIRVSATPERLEQVQDLLERYDVPAPNVRLRFQLIEADGFTDVDSAIAEVEAALRELFRFGGYRLVTEAMVTAKPYSETSQVLIGTGNMRLHLNVRVGEITNAADRSSIDLRVELAGSGTPILSTGVVVPGGQTVVLGTARPFENRGALILVVRPEID